MNTELLQTIPVLPSADIKRDVEWYQKMVGFEVHFSDEMYAVLFRKNLVLHLQWHAGTDADPLNGGSVIRIWVKNIQPLFEELVGRGIVSGQMFRSNTAWQTNEFGFHDLNNNAIFIFEDAGKVDRAL